MLTPAEIQQVIDAMAATDYDLAPYTWGNVEETIRKTLTPSMLVAYLPKATPYTTPALVANTPTKLTTGSTIKYVSGFTLDSGNTRYYLSDPGVVNRKYRVAATFGISAADNNIVVQLELYKNGVAEPGMHGIRKIAIQSDVGNMSMSGVLELSTNDYFETFITVDGATEVTIQSLSVEYMEVN